MPTQYIAIERASDVFEQAMKGQKKWFERIYISPLIQHENNLYRTVSTLSIFNKKKLRKVVICTEQGEIVQSKELSQQIFKVLIYLHYYKVFSENMALDEQQRGNDKFDSFKDALQQVQIDLNAHLTVTEQQVIHDQLNYYEAMTQSLDRLSDLSKICLGHLQQMEQLTANSIVDREFIHVLKETIIKRGRLRGDVEFHFINNGLTTRKQIQKILYDKRYREKVLDREMLVKVLLEANNAKYIGKSIINKGKKDWKFYRKWLGINEDEFTLEKFTAVLKNENEAERFLKTNMNIITKEHWIFSPYLKY